GDGTFEPPVSYAAGGALLAVGDVTGDGIQDVVTGGDSALFHVLRGFGDGTFDAPAAYATANTPKDLMLYDMNADGSLDAIVAAAPDTVLMVHHNDGTGVFPAGSSYFTSSGPDAPRALGAGDLDADGRFEIVVSYTGGPASSLGVFRRDGAGH